jgi:hypothetical protein
MRAAPSPSPDAPPVTMKTLPFVMSMRISFRRAPPAPAQ